MIDPTNNLTGSLAATRAAMPIAPLGTAGAGATAGSSFADTLKSSIDEVSRLQQDASSAVENLAEGKTDNMSGVMTAVEKSDLAFKTLLAIRAKLMDAYDEIKGISL